MRDVTRNRILGPQPSLLFCRVLPASPSINSRGWLGDETLHSLESRDKGLGSPPPPISFLSLRLRSPLFSTASTRSLPLAPFPFLRCLPKPIPPPCPSQPSPISIAVASSRASTSAIGRFATEARSCNASRSGQRGAARSYNGNEATNFSWQ
ncbi:hypothetical protein C4D60_Mb06t04280 [Musa balbisiana]|uniref:Uncharacterized protein n=1 Tax=Musa balbisiana TaxID=52838 RepID=A0A4S8IL86_MUSBA|nr:hypothetical protein C4D60_Mb06t04280 [Musa balbisiana]